MNFGESIEVLPEPQLSPEALVLLQRMGKDAKDLTPEQIEFISSKFETDKKIDIDDRKIEKKEDKGEKKKQLNNETTEAHQEKLKNMEGKELTIEKAKEFREVVKEAGIEVEMTKEEAVPVVQATNDEFTQEIEDNELLSAFFDENDPEQELNRKKIHGEMILLTLSEVYKGQPIPEKTFGSIGAEGTASINLYEMMIALYSHDHFFDKEGRLKNEGVIIIEKMAVNFYDLEKKHGSLHLAFRDNSKENPFYCISQQEFVAHRLKGEGAKKVWAGQSNHT